MLMPHHGGDTRSDTAMYRRKPSRASEDISFYVFRLPQIYQNLDELDTDTHSDREEEFGKHTMRYRPKVVRV